MFLIIGLGGLFVACVIVCFQVGDFGTMFLPCAIGATFSGIFLAILLLAFPIQRYETMGNIAEFKATQATLNNARLNGNVLENAALQQKVVECNSWLGSHLYYKSTMWGLWIPNEILSLTPMK
jgi:hypothetical protein